MVVLEIAGNIMFGDLCYVLEQLYKTKVHVREKEQILHKYINNFKCNAATYSSIPANQKNTSFYPILRLLVPSYERERGAYNLKEQKLGSLLVKVLSLDKQSHDAKKLLNTSVNSQDGDFGNVAYLVLKSRISQKSCNLSVGDINDILDNIAAAEVGNKGAILDDLFSKLIRNLTPEQSKWFLRIILKDLKLGMSAKRILSCYHPDAPELYDKFNNLAKVCEELEEGNTRPLELGIELFFAVSPMLSQRLNLTELEELPVSNTYQIEEKYDGERFQIHMKTITSDKDSSQNKHVFEYFSRKGFTYSEKFGKTYESGAITPKLKGCFNPSVTSFILDGEMMGWNKKFQRFGSKGMSYDVKNLSENSTYLPCFCAYDILYYNGKSLVGPQQRGGMKLRDRLKILDELFEDKPGVITHTPRKIATQSSDILDALNSAIDNQEEGIVLKDVDSYYIANQRNAGWYKLKPEYIDGVMDDLDLVIIGVDMAKEKHRHMASSFLLAVADPEPGIPGEDKKTYRWVCVGRVATGLSGEQWTTITNMLSLNWNLSCVKQPPPLLVFNKIKPDYWILPEHSIVLQVRATELIRNSKFGTTHTLRFPRIKRVRDDKPIHDAMTLQEFNKLVGNADPVVKLTNKRVGDEDLLAAPEDKIKRKRVPNVPQVPDELRRTTAGPVLVTSQALKGKKICILSDNEDYPREVLIRIVESHGGRVVANPGADTYLNVVGRMTHRICNLKSQKQLDIVTTSWLRYLRPSSKPVALNPGNFISMKMETRMQYATEYDLFGDSYTKPATQATLKDCMERMTIHVPEIYLTTQEMLDLDADLFGDGINPFSYMRPCTIHLIKGTDSILAFKIKMFGAKVCEIDDINVTHIVVPKTIEMIEIQALKAKVADRKVPVVSEEWLEKCFSQKKLVSDSVFTL